MERLERVSEIVPTGRMYVGDGSSNMHVMLHVNNRDGLATPSRRTSAFPASRDTTVLSDNAFSVLVPRCSSRSSAGRRRRSDELFDSYGLSLHGWEKAHTDWVTVRDVERTGRGRRVRPRW